MAKIPDSLDTGLTAEEVLEAFDNALNNYPDTKSEVEEARGEYDSLDERLDEMSSDTPSPSTAAPAMDGTAAAGTSTDYARADHVHPSDTSKQDALTAAQLAAVNSGINSEKVAQYDSTTELEAKDSAALVELVDGGPKNCLPMPSSLGGELANKATIATDGTITITLDAAMESEGSVQWDFPLSAGTLHFSCGENSSMSGVYDCYIRTITSPTTVLRDNSSPPGQVATIASGNYRCYIRMRANAPAGTYVFKPMLCTKAAWDISHAYQPYRPSYQELYEIVKALQAAT